MDRGYQSSMDGLVTIRWGGRGRVAGRRSAWGGEIHTWKTTRLATDVYLIAKAVSLAVIDAVSKRVLLPSDAALFAYPHGKTAAAVSAMWSRP